MNIWLDKKLLASKGGLTMLDGMALCSVWYLSLGYATFPLLHFFGMPKMSPRSLDHCEYKAPPRKVSLLKQF